MRPIDRCPACSNCVDCHLPKDPHFFYGWEVNIPEGWPWIEVPEEMDMDEGLALMSSIPRQYDFQGRPCSNMEAMFLMGSPLVVVNHSDVRYRRKWYRILTDWLPMDHSGRLILSRPGRHLYLPEIYETDIVGPEEFQWRDRYSLRRQAERGHKSLRKRLRGGVLHAEIRRTEKFYQQMGKAIAGMRTARLPINGHQANYKYQRRR